MSGSRPKSPSLVIIVRSGLPAPAMAMSNPLSARNTVIRAGFQARQRHAGDRLEGREFRHDSRRQYHARIDVDDGLRAARVEPEHDALVRPHGREDRAPPAAGSDRHDRRHLRLDAALRQRRHHLLALHARYAGRAMCSRAHTPQRVKVGGTPARRGRRWASGRGPASRARRRARSRLPRRAKCRARRRARRWLRRCHRAMAERGDRDRLSHARRRAGTRGCRRRPRSAKGSRRRVRQPISTSSHTARSAAVRSPSCASRTMPPLPTASRPASNCGLTRNTPQAPGAASCNAGGSTRRSEMNETSATITCGASPTSAAVRSRAFSLRATPHADRRPASGRAARARHRRANTCRAPRSSSTCVKPAGRGADVQRDLAVRRKSETIQPGDQLQRRARDVGNRRIVDADLGCIVDRLRRLRRYLAGDGDVPAQDRIARPGPRRRQSALDQRHVETFAHRLR